MIELLSTPSIAADIQQEEKFSIQETLSYGLVLTCNGEIIESERDGFFYHEMTTHSALFSHSHPQKVAILGQSFGIIDEVLKHPSISEITCIDQTAKIDQLLYSNFPNKTMPTDLRIVRRRLDVQQWLEVCDNEHYDVIISTLTPNYTTNFLQHCHRILKSDGIFIQPCEAIFINPFSIKTALTEINNAGFNDWQLLTFPKPSHSLGSQTLLMCTKSTIFRHLREKQIFNRSFTTRFYNFAMHQASLALPQFVQEALEDVSIDFFKKVSG